MAFNIEDIESEVKLPEIPQSMPVFTVKAASLDERKNAIEMISNECRLGDISHTIKLEDSLHFISKQGVLQYYRPSGAIWARNVAADESFKDERRPWKTEKVADEEDKENFKLVLPESIEKELTKKTQALFGDAKLLGKQAYFSDVSLEEISELNKEGKEIERFPGEATVRFLYKLERVAVDGAGAKSYAYFCPINNKPKLIGVFHTWRDVVDSRSVRMSKIEEIFDKVINKDRELDLYSKKGYEIKLTKMELVYYSFPPFSYQEYVFPAFRVNGFVVPKSTKSENRKGFVFARYFHAVAAEEYAKAGLYVDYLTTRL